MPQPDGRVNAEPHGRGPRWRDAVVYMAGLPLSANVQFLTVMATKMPLSAAAKKHIAFLILLLGFRHDVVRLICTGQMSDNSVSQLYQAAGGRIVGIRR